MARPYHRPAPDGLVIGPDPADAIRVGVAYVGAGLLTVSVGLVNGWRAHGRWLDVLMGCVVLGGVVIIGMAFSIVGLANRRALRRSLVLEAASIRALDDPGRAIRRDKVLAVAVTRPSRRVGWLAIELQVEGGTWVSGAGGFSPRRTAEVVAAAEALASALGVPAWVPAPVRGA